MVKLDILDVFVILDILSVKWKILSAAICVCLECFIKHCLETKGITKGSRQNKKTVKLGNFSQPPMTPPPPS
jgi:hypothetical protein